MFLSEHGSSQIEKVVNILLDVEGSLDEVKAGIEQKKHELRELAREAAEKARDQVIKEVTESMQKALDETRSEAEAEAEKILTKSEQSIKELKKKIDERFQDALDLVSKRVLGEEGEA